MNKTTKLFAIALLLVTSTSLMKAMDDESVKTPVVVKSDEVKKTETGGDTTNTDGENNDTDNEESKVKFSVKSFLTDNKGNMTDKWANSSWLGHKGLFVSGSAVATLVSIFVIKKIVNKVKTRRMKARKLA